jgi:hypothetical protein
MRTSFYLLAACCFLIACNNNADNVTEAKEEAKDTAKEAPVMVKETDRTAIQSDSTIHFTMQPGVDSVTGKGHLDKKGDPVICYIDIEKGKKITGKVIPGKAGANIRFSHIYLPDGSSDGPFGQTIEYNAKQTGTYRLFISPNRMAGDPESTDFTVAVKVQ